MTRSGVIGGLVVTCALWAQSPPYTNNNPPPNAPLATAATPRACTTQEPIGNWEAATQLIAGTSNAAYVASFSDDQKAAWTEYAKTAGADWARLKRRYVDRIATWRTRNLPKSTASEVVFYPFSGPDGTNPLAFFPDAREYVLAGLEPPGCIPASADAYVPEYWPALRQGWQLASAVGFFKTEDMRRDLTENSAGGVLPVLLFLIARAGNAVVDVAQIGVTSTGAVVMEPAPSAGHGGPPNPAPALEIHGVEIRFKDAAHGERILRYFAADLRDSRLARRPGTAKYLESLPNGPTLVKSASYLMHRKSFSKIRGTVLARSAVLVEDDSGVPYHYLDPAAWDVRLFGAYDKPIDLFKGWVQEDLKSAYEAGDGVQPLDFGISYKWRPGESNLLVAVRRSR